MGNNSNAFRLAALAVALIVAGVLTLQNGEAPAHAPAPVTEEESTGAVAVEPTQEDAPYDPSCRFKVMDYRHEKRAVVIDCITGNGFEAYGQTKAARDADARSLMEDLRTGSGDVLYSSGCAKVMALGGMDTGLAEVTCGTEFAMYDWEDMRDAISRAKLWAARGHDDVTLYLK